MINKAAITNVIVYIIVNIHSHVTLQPKTDYPLKLSRVEPGQYLDRRPPGKTRLLLEEVLWRFSTAWYGTVRHGSVRYGTAQFGSVCISTAV